ncbi:MAG: DUF4430 domain-containing protein [Lachnospiraceae bacterium]|nr:DUF4430 domain-containing protein [Lachnospiraceae bacterium]
MKMKRFKTKLSCILCTVLIVAMALFTTACSDDTNANAVSTETAVIMTEGVVLGEGATAFHFTVVDKDGKEITCEIHTDKTTVGDALLELGLIAGDEGPYGLYVKTVNGLTVDYDKDGKYWSFYVNGEYGSAGVDTTEIVAGASYAFKVE